MDIKLSELPILDEPPDQTSYLPLIHNGSNYIINISAAGSVTSVAGRNGSVSLSTSDIHNPYGSIATSQIVTTLSSTASQTGSSPSYVDETLLIMPSASLSSLTWALPTASNSRVGQIATFISTENISSLTVNGLKMGNNLTMALANEAYSYQCVLPNGTFIRLA